jgi:hypothetical protein
MTTPSPDIFCNVHKGIRKALSEACLALGRADGPESEQAARTLLGTALHFVAHHGENEDVLLLPLLEARVPAVAQAMKAEHEALHGAMSRLEAARQRANAYELYLEAWAFTAAYVEHMRREEQAHDPLIRATLGADELAGFGQKSVARTAPADQRMMLGFVRPAMTSTDANAFLPRLPAELAAELRRTLTRDRA